jgi:hypothetical protein
VDAINDEMESLIPPRKDPNASDAGIKSGLNGNRIKRGGDRWTSKNAAGYRKSFSSLA